MATIVRDAGKCIDDYINTVSESARPIRKKRRKIIPKADPIIVEDWKWGPNYNKDGMVCGFGAFQKYVSFHFFQGARMEDVPAKNTQRIRFTHLDDIHEPMLVAYVKEVVALKAAGVKTPDRTVTIPADLKEVLDKNKTMRAFFKSLSYTHRKEYVRWIEGAKKMETRKTRFKKATRLLTGKIENP